jgi:hypothetical protein
MHADFYASINLMNPFTCTNIEAGSKYRNCSTTQKIATVTLSAP